MNSDIAKKMLRYVQVSSALSKRALDERAELTADRQAAKEASDSLIEAMVSAEAIGEDQKKQAADLLATHKGTAQLLSRAIQKIAEHGEITKKAGTLGKGVDPETLGSAGARASSEVVVGQRYSHKRASDEAILRVLEAPAAS